MTIEEIKELAFKLWYTDDISRYREEFEKLDDADKDRVGKEFASMQKSLHSGYIGM